MSFSDDEFDNFNDSEDEFSSDNNEWESESVKNDDEQKKQNVNDLYIASSNRMNDKNNTKEKLTSLYYKKDKKDKLVNINDMKLKHLNKWFDESIWFSPYTTQLLLNHGLLCTVKLHEYEKLNKKHYYRKNSVHIDEKLVNIVLDYPHTYNVQSSCDLSVNINLKDVTNVLHNVEYEPRINPSSITLKLRHPHSTGKLYQNGKLTCWGCSDEYSSRIAIRIFARRLQKNRFTNTIKTF